MKKKPDTKKWWSSLTAEQQEAYIHKKERERTKRRVKTNEARPGSLTAGEVSELIGYSYSTPFEYAEEWVLR